MNAEHLAYLGLATTSELLAVEIERATTETVAPVEVMEGMAAAEVHATVARRLWGRLRFAHYPLVKRLSQSESDIQHSIDRAVTAELSPLRFVEGRRNGLFLGPPGSENHTWRSRWGSPPLRPCRTRTQS